MPNSPRADRAIRIEAALAAAIILIGLGCGKPVRTAIPVAGSPAPASMVFLSEAHSRPAFAMEFPPDVSAGTIIATDVSDGRGTARGQPLFLGQARGRVEVPASTEVWLIAEGGAGALAGLASLPPNSVNHLSVFSNANFTDEHLALLKGLESLERCQIVSAPVTGEGLAHLKRNRNLRVLALEDLPLTDASLEALRGFAKLEQLHLTDSTLTDAAVVHLLAIRGLERLHIRRAGISREGVLRLLLNKPKMQIYHDYKDLPDRGELLPRSIGPTRRPIG